MSAQNNTLQQRLEAHSQTAQLDWRGLVNWFRVLAHDARRRSATTVNNERNDNEPSILKLTIVTLQNVVQLLCTPHFLELLLSLHPCFRVNPDLPGNDARRRTILRFLHDELQDTDVRMSDLSRRIRRYDSCFSPLWRRR